MCSACLQRNPTDRLFVTGAYLAARLPEVPTGSTGSWPNLGARPEPTMQDVRRGLDLLPPAIAILRGRAAQRARALAAPHVGFIPNAVIVLLVLLDHP